MNRLLIAALITLAACSEPTISDIYDSDKMLTCTYTMPTETDTYDITAHFSAEKARYDEQRRDEDKDVQDSIIIAGERFYISTRGPSAGPDGEAYQSIGCEWLVVHGADELRAQVLTLNTSHTLEDTHEAHRDLNLSCTIAAHDNSRFTPDSATCTYADLLARLNP